MSLICALAPNKENAMVGNFYCGRGIFRTDIFSRGRTIRDPVDEAWNASRL